MKDNDIVKFVNTSHSLSGKFCYEHGITCKIIKTQNGLAIIDAGFGYDIYARISDLEIVATAESIPSPHTVDL